MQKKVLVLGSTGLIGHQVYNYLESRGKYELHDIAYRRKLQKNTILLNARDESSLVKQIIDIKPKYIVNCIGVLIDGSNRDPENAAFLNAYMPHRLARLADEINAKLIHMSTDCVFSGDKKTPYIETDEKDGRGVYAKSKGLGEVISDRHLTLRTSVVGPELKANGEELFHWFMAQQSAIFGFTKAIWSGVTTIELAKAVDWSINNNISGLYHVTNNASISKYELLRLFQKYTEKKIKINPIDEPNIDKSFIDTRLLMNYKIPSYETMIANMIDMIVNDKCLYSQYKVGSFDKE